MTISNSPEKTFTNIHTGKSSTSAEASLQPNTTTLKRIEKGPKILMKKVILASWEEVRRLGEWIPEHREKGDKKEEKKFLKEKKEKREFKNFLIEKLLNRP